MLLALLFWCCTKAMPSLASDYSCPTWLFFDNSTLKCECSDNRYYSGYLYCNQETMKVQLKSGYCVTYSGQGSLFYGGNSPLWYKVNHTNRLYSELPSDPALLEEAMCGPYNRKGFQCSECIDGYGPAVYSLDRTCVDCSKLSTGSAICLYVLVAFVPIALCFLLVLIFRLNVTSGPMLGYVLFCQGLSVAVAHYMYIYSFIQSHALLPFKLFLKISVILFEAWNMGFLRHLIPPFCISEKLKDIHVVLLNILPTTFPIVLVVISFVLMELYTRNCRIVKVLWKPFGIILGKTNITSVTSDSLIRAFATFIFLSSTMSMVNVYAMTERVTIVGNNGQIYRHVLYFDATVEYLSPANIFYLSISLLQYTIVVFLPSLLLVIYPTRVYRFCCRYISGRKQLAIMSFVEALNNCFKDGLNGTKDYRYFAGVCILCIPIIHAFCGIVQLALGYGYVIDMYVCFIFTFFSLFVSYVNPCKSTLANISLSFYFMLFGLCALVHYLWMLNVSTATGTLELAFLLIVFAAQLPIIIWAGYNFVHFLKVYVARCGQTCIR